MPWKIVLRGIGDSVPVGITVPTIGQTTPRSLTSTFGEGAGLKLSTPGMLESVSSGAQRGVRGHAGHIGATFPTKCRIDAYDFR